jgi:hypothetical protein
MIAEMLTRLESLEHMEEIMERFGGQPIQK